MSGLLKRLQKCKQGLAEEEASNVVIRAAESRSEGTNAGPIVELQCVIEEGGAAGTGSVRQDTVAKVVRSGADRTTGRDLELDDSPWWIHEEKKTNSQVEALIAAARQKLNDVFPEDGSEADIVDAVKQAVTLASDSLRDEVRLTRKVIEQAETELLELLAGKGPLRPLYEDPGVTDIFIDNYRGIKVIRRGHAMETPFVFRSPEEYRLFVTAMLQSVNRSLNLSSPIVDCVLEDQWRSRVNALDSSVVEGDEPRVTIRVPRLQKISFYDILHSKTLPPTVASWLAEVVAQGETNILVVGATGSGKTVMTTALLSSVASDERIITIEDVPEIFVPTNHIEKLVARPANAQGEGEVTMADLLRASLRRAPHRIVVGEIRDEEGRLFLRALETGHAGSIATIHADCAVDALWRLLDLVAAFETAPQESIMRRICRSVHLVLTMKKVDGAPCLVEVAEVRKPQGFDFEVLPIVKYGGLQNGKRQWRLLTEHSIWLDRIAELGLPLRAGPGLKPEPQSGESRDA